MSQPTPTTTRSRRELRAWRNAVFVIFILSGLAMATWVARIPGVRDDLGLGRDPSAVGLLILGMSVGAIIGLSVSSLVMVRFGPHKGMVGGLTIVAIGTLLIGFGSSVFHAVPLVAIGLILLGFGNGMVDVMMNVEGTAVEREIGGRPPHRGGLAPRGHRGADGRRGAVRHPVHPTGGGARRRDGGAAAHAVRAAPARLARGVGRLEAHPDRRRHARHGVRRRIGERLDRPGHRRRPRPAELHRRRRLRLLRRGHDRGPRARRAGRRPHRTRDRHPRHRGHGRRRAPAVHPGRPALGGRGGHGALGLRRLARFPARDVRGLGRPGQPGSTGLRRRDHRILRVPGRPAAVVASFLAAPAVRPVAERRARAATPATE